MLDIIFPFDSILEIWQIVSKPFNNRELATGFWLFVLLGFALYKSTIRESLRKATESFFHPKVLIFIGLIALYTVVIVAVLFAINFWNMNLLKGTVFWFCFTGVVLAFNSFDLSNNENIFSKSVANNLKVMIIIQFLVNSFTFPLAAELVFIPFVALVLMLNVVAHADEKDSEVAKLTDRLQIFIGLAVLVFALIKAFVDHDNLLKIDTLRNFLLPPMLSILFSPFIYLSLVFIRYESLFVQLKLGPEKDNALKRYAKKTIIMHCRLNLSRIQKFRQNNALDLRRIQTTDDVDNMLISHKNQ